MEVPLKIPERFSGIADGQPFEMKQYPWQEKAHVGFQAKVFPSTHRQ
jgi:hypothetical protein